MNTLKLHIAISKVCPIDGVSSNGRIDFKIEATNEQKIAAQTIIDNWVDVPDAISITKLEFKNRLIALNKYKWQIINEIALEKETNTSFNVNAESEYSARFKQYLADGGQVDPADVEPTPVKRWTPYEFRNKFTQAERIKILNSSDPIVKDLWSGFSTAQEIIADHSETLQGMAYLVSVGIIDEARKNEILS